MELWQARAVCTTGFVCCPLDVLIANVDQEREGRFCGDDCEQVVREVVK